MSRLEAKIESVGVGRWGCVPCISTVPVDRSFPVPADEAKRIAAVRHSSFLGFVFRRAGETVSYLQTPRRCRPPLMSIQAVTHTVYVSLHPADVRNIIEPNSGPAEWAWRGALAATDDRGTYLVEFSVICPSKVPRKHMSLRYCLLQLAPPDNAFRLDSNNLENS